MMNDELVKAGEEQDRPNASAVDASGVAESMPPDADTSYLIPRTSYLSDDDLQEQDSGGDPTQLALPLVPTAQPAPSLAQTASRAMLWNTLLFPLKFAVSIASSIILANLLPTRTDYGLVAFVSTM